MPDFTVARFGAISGGHPLYFIATWAPAITGLTLVVACTGLRGLRSFFSRLLIWRCAPVWWVFILLGIPIVFMAGSLCKGGPLLAPLPPGGAGAMLALLGVMLFLGPVEELGWRGVAVAVVWWKREEMFSRGHAVTTVIPASDLATRLELTQR